jgi:hypothetical protein
VVDGRAGKLFERPPRHPDEDGQRLGRVAGEVEVVQNDVRGRDRLRDGYDR